MTSSRWMRWLVALATAFAFMAVFGEEAAAQHPLVFSASGCASGCTQATEQDESANWFTFPFNAKAIFVKNDETAGDESLWVCIDGTNQAVASGGDSRSWEIKAAEGFTFNFGEGDRGPRRISLVTATGETASFRIDAFR